jgi:hypothetical protein
MIGIYHLNIKNSFFLKTELVVSISLRIAMFLLCSDLKSYPSCPCQLPFVYSTADDRKQRAATLASKIIWPSEGCSSQHSEAH